MTSTEFMAWWGAILSTVVFGWDIYKWKTSGARLSMSLGVNMRSFGFPEHEGKTLLVSRVTNNGDRPTSITTVVLHWYPSKLARVRNKPEKSFFLPSPNTAQSLPFVLSPGEIWSGIGEQTEEIEGLARSGILVWEVHHSQKRKPLRAVVKL